MIANNAAAENGREGCLRVLHELGGDAAASLAAADVLEHGHTPAHLAAEWGHDRAACACCTSWGATQRLVWRQHQIVPRPPTLPLCAGTRAVCACAARAGRRVVQMVIRPPTLPLSAGTRDPCVCCTSWAATRRPELGWWLQQMQMVRSPPTLPLGAGTRAAWACCTSWARRRGASLVAANRDGRTPAHLARAAAITAGGDSWHSGDSWLPLQ